ncbi:hypothetical protein GGS20DRAFT_566546 [Poronia punctata]|nr:hypothetical protein GGS20DRAFT_566546 [Poronia punctata]
MQLPSSLLFLLPYTTVTTARALSPRDTPSALPHITSVTYSGDGCPSSSPGVERTGAGFGDVGFKLNGFEASLPGIEHSSTNCQIHLQASGCTAGWQVGIQSATVKGHLVLDAGASFDWFLTSYWSQDAGATGTIQGTVSNTGSGRLDQDISKTASASAGLVAWSPCARDDGGYLGILNVNFRVALSSASGDQYAFFGKDSHTPAAESWSYVWRRC